MRVYVIPIHCITDDMLEGTEFHGCGKDMYVNSLSEEEVVEVMKKGDPDWDIHAFDLLEFERAFNADIDDEYSTSNVFIRIF